MIEQWMLDQLTVVNGELRRNGKGTDNRKPSKNGYVYITFWDGKKNHGRLLHRLLFVKVHGFEPEFIDHIDGDTTHNRIENLRECSTLQNNWNMKKSVRNKSGWKGVHFMRTIKRWRGEVRAGNQRVRKTFGCPTAAYLFTVKQRSMHGAFANNGEG